MVGGSWILIGISAAWSAVPPKAVVAPNNLSDQLSRLRSRVVTLEEGLLDGLKGQESSKSSLARIKELMRLQREERVLGVKRVTELEHTIGELQIRRGDLREKITIHQQAIRRSLVEIGRSLREPSRTNHPDERERIEAPRRRVLASLIDRNVKEVEALKADLSDADQLEAKIQQEQGHLAYLFQDLQEQASVLELNRQMQIDVMRSNRQKRVAQLENYRKLKGAESQVEHLLGEFNARKELEKSVENERLAARDPRLGAFAKTRGSLRLPINGPILSKFGQSYDERTKLQIFKKGVEIGTRAGTKLAVTAISGGKIAYAGELPNYGRVTIIDHGDHFYSLCAHLGEVKRKVGEVVAVGDVIGTTDDRGEPIYFEIRSRNIAVNPLQWVSN